MKSLILIPSYLWKNTFKRWFENPVSPISKILVPLLLGLLASLVLVFFAEVENQLRIQLQQGNSFSFYLTEQVSSRDRGMTAQQTIQEEAMWQSRFGKSAELTYVRQPHLAASWRGEDASLPVIFYSSGFPELLRQDPLFQAPSIWLLSTEQHSLGTRETVSIGQKTVEAITTQMPEKIDELINKPQVLAIPLEMAQPLLADGFIVHFHAEFTNYADVREFADAIDAYYKTERRPIRTFSGLSILENLNKIQQVQNYLRLGIIASCGIILALILGTIAWLEYRQEAYLLALLRSFGTPRLLLLGHTFVENALLVASGIGISFYAWKPLYSMLQSKVHTVDLSPAHTLSLPSEDASIILIAGFIGVLVAMIPIAFGLRKPTGLILQ